MVHLCVQWALAVLCLPPTQDLVGHFQEHSLAANFPAIKTTLLYPYREETGRLEGMYVHTALGMYVYLPPTEGTVTACDHLTVNYYCLKPRECMSNEHLVSTQIFPLSKLMVECMDSPLVTVLWTAVYHSLNKSKYANWRTECCVIQFEVLGFSIPYKMKYWQHFILADS